MTSYQGGKKQLGKRIYNVILDVERSLGYDNLPYFEPFCGMCGVLIHFCKEDTDRDVQACDLNKDIILMWKKAQKNWIPPTHCDLGAYNRLKNSKTPSANRGFIGTVCSFSGIFFKGGFRPKSKNYDFCKSGSKAICEYTKYMKDVKFFSSKSYDKFNPKGMLIYCDPPYAGNNINTEYFQNFDHEKFWNVMRKWSKHNIVVISEKTAPKDFKCIWKGGYKVSFLNSGDSKNHKKEYKECLFVHRSYNL